MITKSTKNKLESLNLSNAQLHSMISFASWKETARKKQLTPDGDWNIWLILAGRGWGKTRTGAQDIVNYAMLNPNVRCGVVAPTAADVRKVCFEGPSGILSLVPKECRYLGLGYNKSASELRLWNGSIIQGFPAIEPDRLRGPQFHRIWADELAAWRYDDTYDQMMFGLRLGDNPQLIITTTPRPTDIIKKLARTKDESVYVTSGSTFENKENLAASALARLEERYKDTKIGRQELYAEILDEIEGALWTLSEIDDGRVQKKDYKDMVRIIVAIDPAVTNNENSDETGIVVAGITRDREYYVFEDYSGKYDAQDWGRVAINAYYEYEADSIVAEVNNGGDLVESLIKNIDIDVPYTQVRATRGKILRAEPVAALYQQKRVHHVGSFPELEDQMCNYSPISKSTSPDRLDAMVWAISQLSNEPGEPYWNFHA